MQSTLLQHDDATNTGAGGRRRTTSGSEEDDTYQFGPTISERFAAVLEDTRQSRLVVTDVTPHCDNTFGGAFLERWRRDRLVLCDDGESSIVCFSTRAVVPPAPLSPLTTPSPASNSRSSTGAAAAHRYGYAKRALNSGFGRPQTVWSTCVYRNVQIDSDMLRPGPGAGDFTVAPGGVRVACRMRDLAPFRVAPGSVGSAGVVASQTHAQEHYNTSFHFADNPVAARWLDATHTTAARDDTSASHAAKLIRVRKPTDPVPVRVAPIPGDGRGGMARSSAAVPHAPAPRRRVVDAAAELVAAATGSADATPSLRRRLVKQQRRRKGLTDAPPPRTAPQVSGGYGDASVGPPASEPLLAPQRRSRHLLAKMPQDADDDGPMEEEEEEPDDTPGGADLAEPPAPVFTIDGGAPNAAANADAFSKRMPHARDGLGTVPLRCEGGVVTHPVLFVRRRGKGLASSNLYHVHEDLVSNFLALALVVDELQHYISTTPGVNAEYVEVIFVDGKERSPFVEYWQQLFGGAAYRVRFAYDNPYPPRTCFGFAVTNPWAGKSLLSYTGVGTPSRCYSSLWQAFSRVARTAMSPANALPPRLRPTPVAGLPWDVDTGSRGDDRERDRRERDAQALVTGGGGGGGDASGGWGWIWGRTAPLPKAAPKRPQDKPPAIPPPLTVHITFVRRTTPAPAPDPHFAADGTHNTHAFAGDRHTTAAAAAGAVGGGGAHHTRIDAALRRGGAAAVAVPPNDGLTSWQRRRVLLNEPELMAALQSYAARWNDHTMQRWEHANALAQAALDGTNSAHTQAAAAAALSHFTHRDNPQYSAASATTPPPPPISLDDALHPPGSDGDDDPNAPNPPPESGDEPPHTHDAQDHDQVDDGDGTALVDIEFVEFRDLPHFRAQVNVSARTDVLVGVHGAGLAQLTFMPSWSSVVELMPPGFGTQYHFHNLAQWRGDLYYTAVPVAQRVDSARVWLALRSALYSVLRTRRTKATLHRP